MYWLLYDISDNRRREKIVKLCKDYGLQRVQKSCFLGKLSNKVQNSFCEKVDNIISQEDQVLLIPINSTDMRNILKWGSCNVTDICEQPTVFVF